MRKRAKVSVCEVKKTRCAVSPRRAACKGLPNNSQTYSYAPPGRPCEPSVKRRRVPLLRLLAHDPHQNSPLGGHAETHVQQPLRGDRLSRPPSPRERKSLAFNAGRRGGLTRDLSPERDSEGPVWRAREP